MSSCIRRCAFQMLAELISHRPTRMLNTRLLRNLRQLTSVLLPAVKMELCTAQYTLCSKAQTIIRKWQVQLLANILRMLGVVGQLFFTRVSRALCQVYRLTYPSALCRYINARALIDVLGYCVEIRYIWVEEMAANILSASAVSFLLVVLIAHYEGSLIFTLISSFH